MVKIELSDDVIATVVGGSATEIFGVVGMASKSAIQIISSYFGKKTTQKELSWNLLMQVSLWCLHCYELRC